MDAANIDLKAFTEDFYRHVAGGHLEPVKDTLRYLRHETSVWFEITTLLIPDLNDSDAELDAMTAWIVDELGPDVPIHFTAFHPDYKLLDRRPTPSSTLSRARRIALGNGMRHAYTGNVHDADGSSTYCPSCGARVIGHWYCAGAYGLDDHGVRARAARPSAACSTARRRSALGACPSSWPATHVFAPLSVTAVAHNPNRAWSPA
jgi:pyruvate formate lyase activating enzyme